MQDCWPWVSQYGTHWPPLHSPRSTHSVPSGMWRLTGQSAAVPVHRAFSSQVAKLAERHLAPTAMKLQPERKIINGIPRGASWSNGCSRSLALQGSGVWISEEEEIFFNRHSFKVSIISHCDELGSVEQGLQIPKEITEKTKKWYAEVDWGWALVIKICLVVDVMCRGCGNGKRHILN